MPTCSINTHPACLPAAGLPTRADLQDRTRQAGCHDGGTQPDTWNSEASPARHSLLFAGTADPATQKSLPQCTQATLGWGGCHCSPVSSSWPHTTAAMHCLALHSTHVLGQADPGPGRQLQTQDGSYRGSPGVHRVDAGHISCLEAAIAGHRAGLPGGGVPVVLRGQGQLGRALHAVSYAGAAVLLQGLVGGCRQDDAPADPNAQLCSTQRVLGVRAGGWLVAVSAALSRCCSCLHKLVRAGWSPAGSAVWPSAAALCPTAGARILEGKLTSVFCAVAAGSLREGSIHEDAAVSAVVLLRGAQLARGCGQQPTAGKLLPTRVLPIC